jgi:Activator of Hsp90 ATPase homolog 1-like protein
MSALAPLSRDKQTRLIHCKTDTVDLAEGVTRPLGASELADYALLIRHTNCSETPSMPNTVRLHRVLATKPEKVYRAFVEADAMAKWLPPNGFACTVHHLDAKVGGSFRMSFRNFTTGKSHSFGGQYVELVPGERLRYTDKFDDGRVCRVRAGDDSGTSPCWPRAGQG